MSLPIRTQLIAFAVRLVSDRTTLVHKPDAFTGLLDQLFEQESYDVRIAKNIEKEAARALARIKQVRESRKK